MFATGSGQPAHYRNIRRTFTAALKKAELPESVRLYDLRHTFASLALGAGAHVKVVSDRLGHASAKMTLDVYAHATAPLEKEATSRIERTLFGGPG